MGYEYRVVAPIEVAEVSEDVARSLEHEGFAAVKRDPGRLSVTALPPGESSWGEDASIALSSHDLIVTVHGGPSSIRRQILERVGEALEKHHLPELQEL